MKLAIFPLGNPGDKYRHTRHNAARIVCEAMMNSAALSRLETDHNLNLEVIEPDTYMNESGIFIYNYLRYHKVLPVIMYDDKDLPLGEVKLSFGNSSGGHNGVESVIGHIGTDFYRIRLGIGDRELMPIHGSPMVQDYVMSNFKPEELKLLRSIELHDLVMEAILKIYSAH